MTQAQRDAAEVWGMVFISFGVSLWLHQPWTLVIVGVILVLVGNAGGTHGNPA